ncbi:hypothetical protein EDD11_002914 [Mortierella claussenii]|nr:hypothetical protein EDD11_002914 [Mortierella claussenii]
MKLSASAIAADTSSTETVAGIQPVVLPIELLSNIFAYLKSAALYSCLTVSRDWHAETLKILYRHVVFNRRTQDPIPLAFKIHKHLLRSVDLEAYMITPSQSDDMLDILLGYRCSETLHDLKQKHVDDRSDDDHLESVIPGPNRPKIYPFCIFDDVVFNLTLLTRLELNWWMYSQEVKTNYMDLNQILENLPSLLHLSLCGCDFDHVEPTSPMVDPTLSMYRLQSFEFEDNMLDLLRPDVPLFRRLGRLRSIKIKGNMFYNFVNVQNFKSEWVARSIHSSCLLNLKTIEIQGIAPLYFYLMPGCIKESSWVKRGTTPEEQARLEDIQKSQILEADEVFPDLKSYVSKTYLLWAEDLSEGKVLDNVELGISTSSGRQQYPLQEEEEKEKEENEAGQGDVHSDRNSNHRGYIPEYLTRDNPTTARYR